MVFGLWAVVLLVATTAYAGWEAARHYVGETVNYTEPLLVVTSIAKQQHAEREGTHHPWFGLLLIDAAE